MHALKFYGSRTGRQNWYSAAWGLCGPHEWTYDFSSNSPGTARTGPGSVMWLRHQLYAVHTPLKRRIRNDQVLIRDVTRSIALSSMRHVCGIFSTHAPLIRSWYRIWEILVPEMFYQMSSRSCCVSVHFFVRRTSVVASPASGTAASQCWLHQSTQVLDYYQGGGYLMPLFDWPAMPRRSYGVRKK